MENELEVINFTNIDDEDFTCSWGGKIVDKIDKATGEPEYELVSVNGVPTRQVKKVKVPIEYTIKSGETKQFPKFLAEHFTYHLCSKILRKRKEDSGRDSELRKPLVEKILGSISAIKEEKEEVVETKEFEELNK